MKSSASALNLLAVFAFTAGLLAAFASAAQHQTFLVIVALFAGGFVTAVLLWALGDVVDLLSIIARNTTASAQARERRMNAAAQPPVPLKASQPSAPGAPSSPSND